MQYQKTFRENRLAFFAKEQPNESQNVTVKKEILQKLERKDFPRGERFEAQTLLDHFQKFTPQQLRAVSEDFAHSGEPRSGLSNESIVGILETVALLHDFPQTDCALFLHAFRLAYQNKSEEANAAIFRTNPSPEFKKKFEERMNALQQQRITGAQDKIIDAMNRREK